jgi:hypothetical protein
VNKVVARDGRNNAIEINWADKIDNVGNPQSGANLIGIIDSSELCVRRSDGLAFRDVVLEVTHSFSPNPLILRYSISPDWQAYSAK